MLHKVLLILKFNTRKRLRASEFPSFDSEKLFTCLKEADDKFRLMIHNVKSVSWIRTALIRGSTKVSQIDVLWVRASK